MPEGRAGTDYPYQVDADLRDADWPKRTWDGGPVDTEIERARRLTPTEALAYLDLPAYAKGRAPAAIRAALLARAALHTKPPAT